MEGSKTRAKPAYVEDVHSETDDVVSGTRQTASLLGGLHPKKGSKRMKRSTETVRKTSHTRSASSMVVASSINHGPLPQLVHRYTGVLPFTILSGSHDHSVERNEIKGRPLRKFFYNDEVINGELGTYIEREIFVSTDDAKNLQPQILIEQRTYEAGKEVAVGRELFFGEQPAQKRIYIFKGCGDEIQGIGKPDLHFTFRTLSPQKWSEYLVQSAKYFGYDNHVELRVQQNELKDAGPIVISPSGQVQEQQPSTNGNSSSRGSSHATTCNGRQDEFPKSNVLRIKLAQLGIETEDGASRGDLDLTIHLSS